MKQKQQKHDTSKNTDKEGNNIQNSCIVTNLSMFCMNFGITLLVCIDL